MNKYQIKYQDGMNIMLTVIEAKSTLDARLLFYAEYPCFDILDISVIGGE